MRLAGRMVAITGGGRPVTADVSDEQQVRAAVAAVEAEFGQVDGLGAQRQWPAHRRASEVSGISAHLYI